MKASYQLYRERRKTEAARAALDKARKRLNKRLSPARRRGYRQSYYHTLGDLEAIWRIQDGCCYFTGLPLGRSFAERDFHVDHLMPLVRGGTDDPLNLALTTRAVNREKYSMSRDEFIEHKAYTREMISRMDLIDLGRRLYFKDISRLK